MHLDPDLLADIARAAAQDAGDLDPDLLGRFLGQLADAARTGRRLPRTALLAAEEAGAQAARSGVAARALVDLYLSAAWRVWRDAPTLTEGDGDRVRAAGLAVLRAADDTVAAALGGFQRARAELVRLQEGARHDVAAGLLRGGHHAVAVVPAATNLGLPLSGPLAVLLLGGSALGEAGPALAALPSRVERALAGKHEDAHPLVVLRDGELLCVFSAPDREAVLGATDAVTGAVAQALGPARGSGPDLAWRVSVSLPRIGPTGVKAGYEEARDAARLAGRLPRSEAVADAHDLAVYRVLLRDREAADDLVSTTLAGLLDATGGPQTLLQTMAAYFDCGANVSATARHLHLSVRAVSYRLERIADLIGRDPTDPAQWLTLANAVTAALLTGWPDGSVDRMDTT